MQGNGTRTAPAEFLWRLGRKEYDLSARTHVMGVLNVTPDSFSDGGRYRTVQEAVDRGLAMEEEGADFLDVGGESTRPRGSAYGGGALPVGEEEEMSRVLPVIEGLASRTGLPISIDTTKAAVALRAIDAGACIVNDVSGFRADPGMTGAAARGAGAVVMHMRGTPQTMQTDTHYDDLFGAILEALEGSVSMGRAAGIPRMMVDPGFGFGKDAAQNYRLLAGLGRFARLGLPVLVGVSRKAFLGAGAQLAPGDRLEGSLAAATAAVLNGASVVRVHDVRATVRAVRVADAVRAAARDGAGV
jgi:dihydropteroate synthase